MVLLFTGLGLITSEFWLTTPISNTVIDQLRIKSLLLFTDKSTQWMTMTSLLYGLAVLTVVRVLAYKQGNSAFSKSSDRQSRSPAEDTCISALALSLAAGYFLNYQDSANHVDAIVLMTCLFFGQSIGLWKLMQSDQATRVSSTISMLQILVLILACFGMFRTDLFHATYYHSERRWNGVWENPNVFGLLMGMGLTLALGLILKNLRYWRGKRIRFGNYFSALFIGQCVVGASLIVSLLMSYSRGAWLATILGSAYLITFGLLNRSFNDCGKPSLTAKFLLIRNLPYFAILSLSLLLLAAIFYRSTDELVLRRALSISNINDFSWRNRLTAYEGSLQMAQTKYLGGYGWGNPQKYYEAFFQPANRQGLVVSLNGYAYLLLSAGIAPLSILCAYLWCVFGKRIDCHQSLDTNSTPDAVLFAAPVGDEAWQILTCRAAALVLLVGVCFEGGFFSLSLGVPLWGLLELGRPELNHS